MAGKPVTFLALTTAKDFIASMRAFVTPVALGLLLIAAALRADAGEDVRASPWREIAPGVQAARGDELGADARWGARLSLVDPAQVQLSVQFDPQTPRIAEWRARNPAALLLVNGSYYSLEHTVRPTCDLISSGKLVHGAGCHVRDALYLGAQASSAAGPAARILTPDEFLASDWSEALKSFPSLVRGGVPGCLSAGYCAESSRTAAVAVLRDGRLLFFATQWPAVRRDVARFLAEQMGAVEALNLDGGPEATMVLRGEQIEESVATPGTPLPLMLAVLPRPPAHAPPAPPAAPPPSRPTGTSPPATGAPRRAP